MMLRSTAVDERARAAAQEPLRIGVLGAAKITDEALFVPALDANCRIVAVAARDPRRAAEFAAQHGIERVYDTYDEVIADPDVDVVYNPLPNAMHAPWNLAAIAAGKHVFSEKPSASNAREAMEVRAAVDASGVHFMEALHYRYHPVMLRMMELVATGELGEIELVEASMTINPPPEGDLRWSYPLAGGCLMDLGSYTLHVQRTLGQYLGGEPTVTAATAGEGPIGVDAWANVELSFPSGARGLALNRFDGDEWVFPLRVVGSRGEAIAHQFSQPHADDRITVTVDGRTRVERHGDRTSYDYQFDALDALVRSGVPVPTDAADAVGNMLLIDAAYEAAGMSPRPSRA
jgi:predicted dehydrogenase